MRPRSGAAPDGPAPSIPREHTERASRSRDTSGGGTMRVALALLLALAVGVTGAVAQTSQPVNLAFSTLDTGSAWYVYGATMAELLRKTLPAGSNIDVKPRSGGVGNPRLVAKNETPLGLSFTVTNRWAYDGKEAYTDKLENLRGLVGGLDTYYLVALASTKLGINS